MDGRQPTRVPNPEAHPAVRIGLLALIEPDFGPNGVPPVSDGAQAVDVIASHLEPLLGALTQLDRLGGAQEVRMILAVFKWRAGSRDPAVAVLEPESISAGRDAYARALSGTRQALVEPLSQRELEVLRLLSAGFSNKDLASRLSLSVGTVKQHLHHINGKLGTTSRTSALARARDLGIL